MRAAGVDQPLEPNAPPPLRIIALFHAPSSVQRAKTAMEIHLKVRSAVQANESIASAAQSICPGVRPSRSGKHTPGRLETVQWQPFAKGNRDRRALGANVGGLILQRRRSCLVPCTNPSRSQPIHPDDHNRSNGISSSRATNSSSDRQQSKQDSIGPQIVHVSIQPPLRETLRKI